MVKKFNVYGCEEVFHYLIAGGSLKITYIPPLVKDQQNKEKKTQYQFPKDLFAAWLSVRF